MLDKLLHIAEAQFSCLQKGEDDTYSVEVSQAWDNITDVNCSTVETLHEILGLLGTPPDFKGWFESLGKQLKEIWFIKEPNQYNVYSRKYLGPKGIFERLPNLSQKLIKINQSKFLCIFMDELLPNFLM